MQRVLALLLITLSTFLCYGEVSVSESVNAAPYFQYSPYELKEFKALSSDYTITKEALKRWDKVLEKYAQEKGITKQQELRMVTYLYAAQRDFVFLSKEAHGEMIGSIDTLSFEMMRLFDPLFPLPFELSTDLYSTELAEVVLRNYAFRYEKEAQHSKDYIKILAIQTWGLKPPSYGKEVIGWIPWKVPPVVLGLMPAAPSRSDTEFWDDQLKQAKEAFKDASPEQKKVAANWSKFYQNNWISVANNYLFSKEDISLSKVTLVRSILSMALFDTLIAVLEGKYTYQVPPPYIRDTTIKPHIEYNFYPSYPSHQASLSYTAAEVLSYFFPENEVQWNKMAEESAQSRMWAGLNYPIDLVASKALGETVFKKFIKKDE